MATGPGDVASDMRSGRPRPVYLLYGDEEYLRDEAASKIVDACLDPDMRDFNYSAFRAGDADVTCMAAALMSPPAFGERRVVVVRGFDELSSDQQKSLVGALERMPRTSVAILVAACVDERTVACKAVARMGRVVRYRRLYESEAAAWLGRRARQRGVDIRPEAQEYLVRVVGTSVARLAEGLEKACDYAGVGAAGAGRPAGGGADAPRLQVTLDHVKAAAAGEPALGIFDLVDAIGQRDTAKALAAARRLLGFGEVPVRMLAMIARQIRLILQTKALQEQGATVQKIVAATRLQEFMVRKCLGQARHFDIEDLENAFTALARADVDLKSSGAPGEVVLEKLIVHLCTHGGGRQARPAGPQGR